MRRIYGLILVLSLLGFSACTEEVPDYGTMETEAGQDAGPDVSSDVDRIDSGSETGPDSSPDVTPDSDPDTGTDVGEDTGPDADGCEHTNDGVEVCDGIDNDCDGAIDEDVKDTFYADSDEDGFGDEDESTKKCSAPDGYVENANDCDDNDGDIHPDADEVCDDVDNNCDGQIDEDAVNADTYYVDTDEDGFGDANVTTEACNVPSGYVDNDDDCDDSNATVNPDATESCNGVDNDCDGQIDNGVKNTFYADFDGDGYGDTNSSTQACSSPTGYVSDNTDCDDSDSTINPDASETCNGVDDDCDGQTDESNVCAPTDSDNDGVPDSSDNCPYRSNPNQDDMDGDGIGDSCDDDRDGDGLDDTADNCPLAANPNQTDTDYDGEGDVCDADDDGDSVVDTNDNCPLVPNTPQDDLDGDGIGDACDDDVDGDGVSNNSDNCPLTVNPSQNDLDSDGFGDACDSPDCGNGYLEGSEVCDLGADNGQVGSGCMTSCNYESGTDSTLSNVGWNYTCRDGSNCPDPCKEITGDVLLVTSAELSHFSYEGYCAVNGSLTVENAPRAYYLSNLEDVSGNLTVDSYQTMDFYDGNPVHGEAFEKLENVGGNLILKNFKEDPSDPFPAFAVLHTVGGNLEIDNVLVDEIDSFNALTSVGNLWIQNNYPFGYTQTIPSNYNVCAEGLHTLKGFNSLTSVSGSLRIRNNLILEDISGAFTQLSNVSGDAVIRQNKVGYYSTYYGLWEGPGTDVEALCSQIGGCYAVYSNVAQGAQQSMWSTCK